MHEPGHDADAEGSLSGGGTSSADDMEDEEPSSAHEPEQDAGAETWQPSKRQRSLASSSQPAPDAARVSTSDLHAASAAQQGPKRKQAQRRSRPNFAEILQSSPSAASPCSSPPCSPVHDPASCSPVQEPVCHGPALASPSPNSEQQPAQQVPAAAAAERWVQPAGQTAAALVLPVRGTSFCAAQALTKPRHAAGCRPSGPDFHTYKTHAGPVQHTLGPLRAEHGSSLQVSQAQMLAQSPDSAQTSGVGQQPLSASPDVQISPAASAQIVASFRVPVGMTPVLLSWAAMFVHCTDWAAGQSAPPSPHNVLGAMFLWPLLRAPPHTLT